MADLRVSAGPEPGPWDRVVLHPLPKKGKEKYVRFFAPHVLGGYYSIRPHVQGGFIVRTKFGIPNALYPTMAVAIAVVKHRLWGQANFVLTAYAAMGVPLGEKITAEHRNKYQREKYAKQAPGSVCRWQRWESFSYRSDNNLGV